jgi:hypothetical protein
MDRVFLVELAGAHIPYFIGAVGLAFQSAIPSKSLIYGMHIHACAIHPMFNIYQDVSLGRPLLVVMGRRVAAVLFFIALQKSTLGAVCIPLWSMSIFAAVLYLGICWVMSSGLLAESILHQKPPEEPLSQFAMLALIALLVASPGVPWLVAKKSRLTSFGDLRSDVEVSKQLPEARDAAKAEFHKNDRQSSDELHEWENDLEMQRSEIDIGTISEQSYPSHGCREEWAQRRQQMCEAWKPQALLLQQYVHLWHHAWQSEFWWPRLSPSHASKRIVDSNHFDIFVCWGKVRQSGAQGTSPPLYWNMLPQECIDRVCSMVGAVSQQWFTARRDTALDEQKCWSEDHRKQWPPGVPWNARQSSRERSKSEENEAATPRLHRLQGASHSPHQFLALREIALGSLPRTSQALHAFRDIPSSPDMVWRGNRLAMPVQASERHLHAIRARRFAWDLRDILGMDLAPVTPRAPATPRLPAYPWRRT